MSLSTVTRTYTCTYMSSEPMVVKYPKNRFSNICADFQCGTDEPSLTCSMISATHSITAGLCWARAGAGPPQEEQEEVEGDSEEEEEKTRERREGATGLGGGEGGY